MAYHLPWCRSWEQGKPCNCMTKEAAFAEIQSLRAIIDGKDEEIVRLHAELTEARKPDCRFCQYHYRPIGTGTNICALSSRIGVCEGGSHYAATFDATPIRLYESDAAMAGGEHEKG